MKKIIAGAAIVLAIALLPPPRISLDNPTLLYAAAIYKTAVGDTGSALRLLERAEAKHSPSVPPGRLHSARGLSSISTAL